jgi:hypothetical protein
LDKEGIVAGTYGNVGLDKEGHVTGTFGSKGLDIIGHLTVLLALLDWLIRDM